MRNEAADLCELRLIPYNEALLRENGIFTIEEALCVDFNWLATRERVGPKLAGDIMDNIDSRYLVWKEHGMQYKGVPGVPDDPSPEEIFERALEARDMTRADFDKLYQNRKSHSNRVD